MMGRVPLVLVFLIALLLHGCKSGREAQQAQLNPPPEWVRNRPSSSMYYIGIGLAQKTPGTNFQRTARDNALSDLASEIQVNVNTNSLLYTLEREYKFEQEFRETIRVSSDLKLEDFEAVDTWEDANSFWVYYRLNKADYAERQRKKQRSAQELALDFLAKAQAARSGQQFASAADFYLRGLQALEMYWGESNQIEFQGQNILLDNELYSGLKSLLNDTRIEIESDLELNYHNRYRTVAHVRVAAPATEIPLEGVPLVYEYFGSYGRFRGKANTNADGRAAVQINEAERDRATNNFIVQIDAEGIFQPFQNDQFMRRLTQSLRGSTTQKPITYIAPSLYIDSSERNLGASIDGSPISAAIMASLGRRGVRFANSPAEADLSLTLRADTRQGGMSQGFATSLLTFTIDVVNNKTRENVYKLNRNDVKGVDLDFDRAGLKAYQNLTRNIESEFMRKLVSDLF